MTDVDVTSVKGQMLKAKNWANSDISVSLTSGMYHAVREWKDVPSHFWCHMSNIHFSLSSERWVGGKSWWRSEKQKTKKKIWNVTRTRFWPLTFSPQYFSFTERWYSVTSAPFMKRYSLLSVPLLKWSWNERRYSI